MALMNLTHRIDDTELPISMDINSFVENLVEAALHEANDKIESSICKFQTVK